MYVCSCKYTNSDSTYLFPQSKSIVGAKRAKKAKSIRYNVSHENLSKAQGTHPFLLWNR